jgi:hypothetical protein
LRKVFFFFFLPQAIALDPNEGEIECTPTIKLLKGLIINVSKFESNKASGIPVGTNYKGGVKRKKKVESETI